MGRKETVHVARHISEEQEVQRIMEQVKKKYGITITKLEASAILAKKSQRGVLADLEVKDYIKQLRGIFE